MAPDLGGLGDGAEIGGRALSWGPKPRWKQLQLYHHELFLTRAATRKEAKRHREADKIDNETRT